MSIVAENAETTGVTNWSLLEITGYGDINAQGFARSMSVNVGETIEFCVDGDSTVIDIYRVGWYGGDGYRLIASVTNTPTVQPDGAVVANSNGGTTCTSWSVTATWTVPSGTVSGMFLALVRSVPPNAPNAFYIAFVVRDDAAQADIIYKTSDSTWAAAYNHYGTKSAIDGKNVYGSGSGIGSIGDRSHVVSYHRPVLTRGAVPQTYWQACEWPTIRWLERNGFNVKYVSSVDLDKQGAGLLASGKIFLSSGHDEYWSQPMRDAVETWRDNSGGKLLFMSANEVFWRVRFTYVGDETQMWCYKDTMPGPGGHVAGAPLDPVSWTGTWKDQRWVGNDPEWNLTGTDFRMNGVVEFPANITSTHPVWQGTNAATGLTFPEVIGFEADSLRPQVDSPVVLAETTVNIDGRYADDNGQTYNNNGDLTWGIVAQRYPGGGLTVGFGTCQWGWALDDRHIRGGAVSDGNAQQFTVNLLTDLGAVAGSLQAGMLQFAANPLSVYGPDSDPGSRWYFHDGSEATVYRLGDSGLSEVYGTVLSPGGA